jgi:hypothetical protein
MDRSDVAALLGALDEAVIERLGGQCPDWREDDDPEREQAWQAAVTRVLAILDEQDRTSEPDTVLADVRATKPEMCWVIDARLAVVGIYARESLIKAIALWRLTQALLADDHLDDGDRDLLGVTIALASRTFTGPHEVQAT